MTGIRYRAILGVFSAATLHRRGYTQDFAVFGNSSPGDIDAVFSQHGDDFVVRKNFVR
jgi:hypothetical protein